MAAFNKRNKSVVNRERVDNNGDTSYINAYLEVDEIDWTSDENTPCFSDDDLTAHKRQKTSDKSVEVDRVRNYFPPVDHYKRDLFNDAMTEHEIGPFMMDDPFDSLSDEMMLKIFSYLPLSNILRCVQVNHRWKFLGYDKQFWHFVNLDGHKLNVDGLLGSILHRGVRVLRLSRAEILSPVCSTDCSFADETCSNFELTHLDASITKFAEDYLTNLLFKCESLLNLSLEGCKIGVPEVTAISLNGHLKTLNLSNVIGLSLPAVDAITRSCLKLESINLSWTNQTRDAIRYLCRCKHLKELNLSGLRGGINRPMMEMLVTTCKHLKSLDFSDVTLQIGTLKLIADNCVKLQVLSISRCSDVKAEQLFELVEMPNLSHLNLFGFNSLNALQRFSNRRPDIYVNKETFSPIARPISTTNYEGRLWEQYVGFII